MNVTVKTIEDGIVIEVGSTLDNSLRTLNISNSEAGVLRELLNKAVLSTDKVTRSVSVS